MRKFFVLLFVLTLAIPSLGIAKDNEAFHRMMSAPGNYLGFQVLAIEADGDKNYVISPTSLALALSMLGDGADTEAQDEITGETFVLNPESAKELQDSLQNSGIDIANALFAKDLTCVGKEYAQSIRNNYNAELFTLNGVDEYNSWVSSKTHGLIEKAINAFNDGTELVLNNVASFDLQWDKPFESGDTFEWEFYNNAGQAKTVEFLHQEFSPNEIKYMDKYGNQAVRLDYKDSDLYMIIVSVGSVSSFLSDLVFQGIGYFDDLAYVNDTVILNVPKFDVTSETQLKGTLQEVGINKIFEAGNHFDRMYSGTGDIKVDDILQKVRIQMDEDGTKAAAVTTTFLALGFVPAAEGDPIVMNVDHPFVIIVADESTNTVCFAGVIADPQ